MDNQKSWTNKVPQIPHASEGHVPIHFFHKYAENQKSIADALATLTWMFKILDHMQLKPIDIETSDDSAYCLNVKEEHDRESL